MEADAQERHRPGVLKQPKKAHKTGRHRSQSKVEKEFKGEPNDANFTLFYLQKGLKFEHQILSPKTRGFVFRRIYAHEKGKNTPWKHVEALDQCWPSVRRSHEQTQTSSVQT
jgi:hypothetical protein